MGKDLNAIYRAHQEVTWAIRSGKLTRPKRCERCGLKKKVDGHHPDYLKPLEVVWLCRKCHSSVHRIARLMDRVAKALSN